MEKTTTNQRFTEATGGRKTATARARIHGGVPAALTVNGRECATYFKTPRQQAVVRSPLELTSRTDLGVTVRVAGGGLSAQAEAVRNAIAKAVAIAYPETKKPLRAAGFITRDARMVERKKFGLKKARRAPQWTKR